MEITPHLNEAELAEFVSNPTPGLGTHLELCDACLSEVARLREAVSAMKGGAEQPEEFWSKQRALIHTRVAHVSRQTSTWAVPRLAWAATAAMVILAAMLLSDGPKPASVAHAPKPDPDHELLLAVERVMHSSGPAALEPASYLAEEISQDMRSHANYSNGTKETSHEN